MANQIELFKKYIPLLDEKYRLASRTAILDGNLALVREGVNAGELIIPKRSMSGLANYKRGNKQGYVDGDISLTYETVKADFDRGRRFTVDAMDNIETVGLAFAGLASEFLAEHVIPELDAYRLAKYASTEGVSQGTAKTLATGKEVIAELRAGTNQMDEDKVTSENRILFITPTLYGMIEDLDTTASKRVLSRFGQIVLVPGTMFYDKVKFLDGESEGQEQGGFAKADNGAPLNFMIIQKDAVIQFGKRNVPKVQGPDDNFDADAYTFAFRDVEVCDVFDNKVKGIYVSKATA